MTLTQLQYIVAVDTHRHFGRAAEECNVSQPTLSMQIRTLEEELGAELFDRGRKPVIPTDLGREIIAQARVILRERDRVDDILKDAQNRISGELSVGIIPTLAPYLLPLVSKTFTERYPEVTLSIRELTTEDILSELARDQLDAGFIATKEEQVGMAIRPLFREEFVSFIAPNHRLSQVENLSVENLDLEDMWILSEGHCFRKQVLDLCREDDHSCGPRRSILFESGNLETVRHMVERSGGMTLLPKLATLFLSSQQKKLIRSFSPPVPYREVSVIYGRAFLKKRLIDLYVNCILEVVPQIVGGITKK
ncbi:MAG: LysR family transcriptional regulator [Ignavibacteriae bacterium]|nr:LysR family transcriptional regulator [Ignavibacteriota bacterium]MCB9214630.1 LysR family transcriptional regulator [Ignavibacteria bacterium]